MRSQSTKVLTGCLRMKKDIIVAVFKAVTLFCQKYEKYVSLFIYNVNKNNFKHFVWSGSGREKIIFSSGLFLLL